MTRFTAVSLLVVAVAACDTLTTPDDQPLAPAPDQAVFAALPAEPEYFYYVTPGGETLRRVDVTAATPTPEDVGPTGALGVPAGLATSRAPVETALGTYPSGTLFGLLGGHLYVFNTATGSAERVVSTVESPALAFGPDGATLFAADPSGGLLVIDPVSGAAAPVASFSGIQPYSSLEFDPGTGVFYWIYDGSLYSWDPGPDPAPSSRRVRVLGADTNVCSVAVSSAGDWYFSNNVLYHFRLDDVTPPLGIGAGVRTCGSAFAPQRGLSLAPVADPGAPTDGAYAGDEGSPVQFDGTASSDPEGSLLTYHWDFGDGATSNEPAPSHAYADDGVHVVTLVVLDEDGGASPEATVEAILANVAPDVDAGPDATAVGGESLTLSATFSDPGALDAPWGWTIDWGDGTSSTGTAADQAVPIEAGHAYADAGAFTVTVTVTDKDGGSGSDALEVHVQLLVRLEPEDLTGGEAVPITLNREGRLTVMIPTVPGLDATQIDPATVRLGDGSDPDAHVAMRRNGIWMAALEDADGDDDTDLVVHFEVPDLVANGDLAPETDALLLRGRTVGGAGFEGWLPVRVVGR